jgi:uncharacterized protein
MGFALGMIGLGLAAGSLSGIFGIGGGILIIPVLVMLAGMDQKTAQGTTLLMMLPPIGVLGALEYWRRGEVNWQAAAWLCVGFVVGGYLGARLIEWVPTLWVRRAFALLMIIMGVRMLWK